jgi:hypothetical protein
MLHTMLPTFLETIPTKFGWEVRLSQYSTVNIYAACRRIYTHVLIWYVALVSI